MAELAIHNRMTEDMFVCGMKTLDNCQAVIYIYTHMIQWYTLTTDCDMFKSKQYNNSDK